MKTVVNIRHFVLVLLTLLCCEKSACSQLNEIWTQPNRDKLKDLLQQMHEAKEFSGTVLIAENGAVKFNESLGYSNIATGREFDSDASFRLASVSKPFTATAIMMLFEQGKLDYEDPITKYLPSLPYDNVTIRHLLNHTSGLPDYMTLMTRHWDPGKRLDKRKIAFNQDAVATFARQQPELLFRPGSKFQYSNTGYVFLGHIIEIASGQKVRDFIIQNIFKPLKMSNSDVFSTSADFNPTHRVYGFMYQKQDPGYRENDFHFLNGMIGDGGLYASALDLVKWDAALYGEKLVKQTTLGEAFAPAKLVNGEHTDYGFGWSIDKKDDGTLQVSHAGGWAGFRTYIARNISDKRTLIILTNNSCYRLGKIFEGLSNIVKTVSPDD